MDVMTQAPELVAHRGDMTRYPENTLPAFSAAIEAGARFVELDIQMSKNAVPMVVHDVDLDRVAGIAACVKDVDAAKLERIKADKSAPPFQSTYYAFIPTLRTFVSFLNEHASVTAFVEIKTTGTEHVGIKRNVERVLGELELSTFPFSVISFSRDVVQFVRKSTSCPIGWVLNTYDEHSRSECDSLAPDYVFCNVNHLSPDCESLWQIDGKWVIYDIVSPGLAMQWFERGADMIETGDIITMLNSPPFTSSAHD